MARRRGNAPEQGEGARHAEVRPEAPEQEEPPSDVNRDDVEPLSAPLFQAGTVALQVIGNEFIIIFQRALRAAQSNRAFCPQSRPKRTCCRRFHGPATNKRFVSYSVRGRTGIRRGIRRGANILHQASSQSRWTIVRLSKSCHLAFLNLFRE